jgi:HTH-type transcriptional regulator / antitoxin HipB
MIMHQAPSTPTRIASAVRHARREHHLRQDELALAAGVSVRTIHQIEAGKPTTRLDVLERVVNALGLSIELAPRWPGGTSGQ